jgi:hypothetical protein
MPVGDSWLHPVDEELRMTTVEERGRLLVDLLLLTDALPPRPRDDLAIPGFRVLCGLG